MSMELNLKEFLEELIQEVEKELDEATATGNVAGYNVPGAFSDGGAKDKKRKKKISTQFGMKIVGKMDEASIKGRNNKTGEAFGMVIGSDKKNKEGEFEVTIRKTYSSRISSYKFMFDKGSNLIAIKDYGYSMDGKFPDMKGGGSVKSIRPNGRETITQIAKITSPAFAKKIVQHVKKVNESVNEAISRSYYLEKYGANDEFSGKKVAKYSKFDKNKIKSDFNRFAKTLKDEEELHFMGVNNDKKRSGDEYLFSVVNQDGENRIEITRGNRTFYKSFKSFKLESVNEVGKGSNWAEKYVNDTNLYKKLNWYIKMGKGAEKKIKGKEFVIMSDGSALIWNTKTSDWELYKPKRIDKKTGKPTYESVNEAKVKRPVNRWLELKNDETMHPHKKMAMGLKELKYQLAETQKFFNWYNKIKTMNELDSNQYWKRTNKHIYKIKERLINIARTIQEIEK